MTKIRWTRSCRSCRPGAAGSVESAQSQGALALIAAFALLVASGCQGGPSAGSPARHKEIILATEYDDRRAGKDAAAEIEAEMGILADSDLTRYVAEIGRRLLRATPSATFKYHFSIVDQAVPNAFSLPGGGIYISRGLIALANNEDELACVIGHEITHAAERHAAARQALSKRGLPIVAGYLRMARLAAYSRDQERDADRGGQRLAAAAGYDPMGLSTFLRKLEDTERMRLGYSRLTGYFDTHPGSVERSAATADRAASMDGPSRANPGSAAADYLAHIDGIVLGPNPAEGIFEGNLFIHPDMEFSLRFPQGWNVFNTHRAVGAVAPARDGWIELSGAPPAESAEEAARMLRETRGKEMKLRVERQLPVKIADLEAFRLEGASVVQGQSVHTTLTFIPYNGMMFQISSYSKSGKSDKYLARGRNTARSFTPLPEESRNAVEILRLRVVRALSNESLSELSHRAGNAFAVGETALLNGVFNDARFQAGDLVKIARSEPYLGPASATSPE